MKRMIQKLSAFFISLMMVIGTLLSGSVPVLAASVQPVFSYRNAHIEGASSVVNASDSLNDLKSLSSGTVNIRYRTAADAGLMALFSVSSTASGQQNTYAVCWIRPGANSVGVEVRDTSGGNYNQESASSAGINDDHWHSLSYVFGAGTFQIWVDGTLQKEASKSGFLSSLSELSSVKIGALDRTSGANNWVFNGDVEAVEVYDRVLSASEIGSFAASTALEPNLPPEPEGSIREEQLLLYQGYAGSQAYRIPGMITTDKGTVLTVVDQRNTTHLDYGNINCIVRRSTDGGKTFDDPITVIDLPSGQQEHAVAIDPSVVQDPATGRIFVFVDVFSESRALMQTAWQRAGTGYKEVDGKKYLILRDYSSSLSDFEYTKEYTVREDGIVYDEETGQPSSYRMPSLKTGDLFKVDEEGNQTSAGNIYLYTGENRGEISVLRTCHLWMFTSDDDGLTWSDPTDLNAMCMEEWMLFNGTGPGRGLVSSTGRLIVPIYTTNSNVFASQSSGAIYSDDHGETWKLAESVNDGVVTGGAANMSSGAVMTECQAVEVTTASGAKAIKMFCRNQSGRVKIATSYDDGQTWEDTFQTDDALPDPYCQMTVIPYSHPVPGYEDKQMFVFANPATPSSRSNGYLRLGYYDPQTDAFVWTHSRNITPDSYTYSVLTELPDGTIGLFWEADVPNLYYTNFSLQWLMADRNPIPHEALKLMAAERIGNDIVELTFDQPLIAFNAPAITAEGGKELVYLSGSGSEKLYYTADTTEGLILSGIAEKANAFLGNCENTAAEGIAGMAVTAAKTPDIENLSVTSGLVTSRMTWDAIEGVESYKIYRSDNGRTDFVLAGESDTASFEDHIGVDRQAFYRIVSNDGAHVSDIVSADLATGTKAWKKSLRFFKDDFSEFDGSSLYKLSAEEVNKIKDMDHGFVIVKYKTPQTDGQTMLMAKEAGSTVTNRGAESIWFGANSYNSGSKARADLIKTRAEYNYELAKDEWHIILMSINEFKEGYNTFAIGADGHVNAWNNKSFVGLFNDLSNPEVTIGGWNNGSSNDVSGGMSGQIAWIGICDENLTNDEIMTFTEPGNTYTDAIPPEKDELEIIGVKAQYGQVKVSYTSTNGGTKDILRSETADGPFEVIGTSDSGFYTDVCGIGKQYFYQIRNSAEDVASAPVLADMKTGAKAMKENAVVYHAPEDKAFDGTRVVDLSEFCNDVKALSTGTVIVRFKADQTPDRSILLMAKEAGTSPTTYRSGTNANIMINNANGTMKPRADLAHTWADATTGNVNDGNWHTFAVVNGPAGSSAFVFSVDGSTTNSFGAGTNNANLGFFSTVPTLSALTLGGHLNGTDVLDGFKGEIDYVVITDEVLTPAQANEVTLQPDPAVLDKEELEAVIAQAKAIDLSYQTEETTTAFNAAIAAAEEVLSNAADQETIDAAVETLRQAIADLPDPDVLAITSVKAQYAQIKIAYTARKEGTKQILRSETADGSYEVIGTSDNGSFIDDCGTDRQYFYKVRNADEDLESAALQADQPTGLQAMKDNAVVYHAPENKTFDGTRVIDLSEHCDDVKGLGTGTIIVRFKTANTPARSVILMAKEAGTSPEIYRGTTNANIQINDANGTMKPRADLAHTWAEANPAVMDGTWHTFAVMNGPAGSSTALVFSLDGTTTNSYGAGTNNANCGFLSTVPNLSALTVGGHLNGTEVLNGFNGEIDYVLITDEVLTPEQANTVTTEIPEPVLDTSPLTSKIEEAEAINLENRDEEAVAIFCAAIETAKAALETVKTDEDVANAVKALDDAIKALPDPKPDTKALEDKIREAEAIDLENRDPEAVKVFQTAVNAAKAALETVKTDQDVADAVKALDDAIKALPDPKPDTKALEDKIAEAETINLENRDPEAVKTFKAAIETAKAALETVKTDADVADAVKALDDAIKALPEPVVKPNTKTLEDKIKEAEAIDLENRDPEAVKVFQTAINTAKAALDTVKTDADVAEAVKALDDAIKALPEPVVKPDTKALEDKIKEAEAIDLENRDPEAVKVFQTAINTAKAALDTVKTDADVAEAVKALDDAIKALPAPVLKPDTKALEDKIKEAEAVDLENRDPEAVKVFQTAINEAKTALETVKTDQDVADAVKALDDAIKALPEPVVKPDTKALEDKIKEAEAVDLENRDPEAVKVFQTAINIAKAALETVKTDQDVADAVKALDDAIKALPEPVVKPDTKALEDKIKEAEAIDLGNRDPEAIKTFQAAIETAKAALETVKTDQDVADAVKALDDAIKALPAPVVKPDTKALEDKIKEAEAIDLTDRDPEAVKAFEAAVEAAREALETAKTDADVAEAVKALDDAIKALPKPSVDTAELEALIEEAKAIDLDGYSETDKEALLSAIAEAEKALDGTQAEVNEAVKVLQAAVDALDPDARIWTVIFRDKDGNVLSTIQVGHKQAALMDAPAVDGYEFIGWSEPVDEVTRHMDVTAQYAAKGPSDTRLALEALVKEASEKTNEDYTDESWSDFQEKLDQAKAALGSEETDDAALEAARAALEEAMNHLETKPVIPTPVIWSVSFYGADGKLIATVEVEDGKAAKAPEAPEVEGYIFKGWDKAFDSVKSNLTVKAVYEKKAPSNPEKPADLSALNDLVKKAEALDLKDYTDSSVKAFEAALKEAKAVLADEKSDQETVDAAKESLKKAMDGLAKKCVKPADKPQTSTGNKKPANTGVTSNVGLIIGLAVAAVVIIGILIWLRKKADKKS